MNAAEFQAAVDAATTHKLGTLAVDSAALKEHGRPSKGWGAEVTSSDGRVWGVRRGWVGSDQTFDVVLLATKQAPAAEPSRLCPDCCVNDTLPNRPVCAGCAS